MGVLELVTKMKSQGKGEFEIIKALQNQGVPPKEIQDAISQAQIKEAVAGETSEMQQSMMDQEQDNYTNYNPEEYVPQPQMPMDVVPQAPYQEQYPQDTSMQSYGYQQPLPQYQYPTQGPPQGQEYYPQEYPEQYMPETYSGDSESLIDVAEQVFSDKSKKMQDSLETLEEFKALTENQVKSFEERLRRIEEIIDRLQISILEKIGSYGENLSNIKKEMSMMQDSFRKIVGSDRPLRKP